jgi:hypothetical protein
MERTGLPYGENEAVNDQQAAAPLSSPGPATSAAASPGRGRGPHLARFGDAGIFSGTQRPGEPLTAGVDFGPGVGRSGGTGGDDPYLLLQAIYQAYPSPQLERLLARVAMRRA